MNDFFSELFSELLEGKTVKSSPDIWFEKVALYRDREKEPVRTISLKRGLNVVQAGVDSVPDEISGHGTGKTTFCRMLRYLLGEPTFANKRDTLLISELFKKGCIAAELHIRDKKWVVRRPFDNTSSFAIENGSIEEVVSATKNGIAKSQYIQTLGLDTFCENLFFRDNRPIQWGHLLAWMTRDQEARLSNIHTWRNNSVSESESPAFANPTQDPLFLMRAALGLLTPDEMLNENKLIQLEKEQKMMVSRVETLQNEPDRRIREAEMELRELLKQTDSQNLELEIATDEEIDSFPWEAEDSLLPNSLSKVSTEFGKSLLKKCEEQQEEYKRRTDKLREDEDSLAIIKDKTKNAEAYFSLMSDMVSEYENARFTRKTKPQPPQTNDVEQRIKNYMERIAIISREFCDYGRICVRECSYFKNCTGNQIERLKYSVLPPVSSPKQHSDKSLIDQHTLEQNEAKAIEEKRQAETRRAILVSQRDQKQKEVDDMKKEIQSFKNEMDANVAL